MEEDGELNFARRTSDAEERELRRLEDGWDDNEPGPESPDDPSGAAAATGTGDPVLSPPHHWPMQMPVTGYPVNPPLLATVHDLSPTSFFPTLILRC